MICQKEQRRFKRETVLICWVHLDVQSYASNKTIKYFNCGMIQ